MKKTIIALLLICTAVFAQQQGSFTDFRDGKKYKTVKIGSQTWMAENLNYNASGSKCYNNKSANCEKYGRLYDWSTAMKSCPSGWYLPSKDEWQELVDFVGGDEVAGTLLKAKAGWAKTGNGTDQYGFSALPGGFGPSADNIYGAGNYGYWWSASEHSNGNAYRRYMFYGSETALLSHLNKSYLYSIRCVQGDAQNTFTDSQQKGSFTDSRDGKTYKTVKIGEQVWMAENLNYNAKGSKCYGEDGKVEIGYDENDNPITITLSPNEIQVNCTKYGRLYDWSTAMNIDAKFNEEEWGGSDVKYRGICPSGWHIPSDGEWDALMTAVGGEDIAETKLKATSGWTRDNGTDDYGFSALPGGYGSSEDGRFHGVGSYGNWWSASGRSSSGDVCRIMYYGGEWLAGSCLYSVRCVQY